MGALRKQRVHFLHAHCNRLLRGALQIQIDGAVNPTDGIVIGLALLQFIVHQIEEVWSARFAQRIRDDVNRFGGRGFVLRLGDVVVVKHHSQHQIAAFFGALRMPEWIEMTGPLHQPRQQRRFR